MPQLRQQQFPELDAYAVRILLSEALPVAGDLPACRSACVFDCKPIRAAGWLADDYAHEPWERMAGRRSSALNVDTILKNQRIIRGHS